MMQENALVKNFNLEIEELEAVEAFFDWDEFAKGAGAGIAAGGALVGAYAALT